MKLINLTNISTPSLLKQFSFGADVASISIQPFNFKYFAIVHFVDESIKVFEIDESNYSSTEQTLQINGST